ncbi:MAG: lactonase family protein [Devosiaceae bacterium]|nr:lactonase family protein [Devosiaceae bacterium]
MTAKFTGFFVGTYNGPDQVGNFVGDGIFHVQIDPASGSMSAPKGVAKCANPSYLAWGRGKKHIFTVKEVVKKHQPELLSFRVENEGALSLLDKVPLEGELPCHLSVNKAGTFLACAQYLTGNVLLFALEPDGKIGALIKNIQHFGSGPNSARQEGPHAHFVDFLSHPDQLAIVDLGLDRVFSYPFSADGNVDIAADSGAVFPGGVGPRHFATINGSSFVYVFCEMQAIIFVFKRFCSDWSEVQAIKIFDDESAAPDSGAAIKISPDGRFLYVSERSRSKIATFSISQKSGIISPVQSISSNGRESRDISISPDGRFLIVANQKSNNLTSFFRNRNSGELKATGYEVELDRPVCILF